MRNGKIMQTGSSSGFLLLAVLTLRAWYRLQLLNLWTILNRDIPIYSSGSWLSFCDWVLYHSEFVTNSRLCSYMYDAGDTGSWRSHGSTFSPLRPFEGFFLLYFLFFKYNRGIQPKTMIAMFLSSMYTCRSMLLKERRLIRSRSYDLL